MNLNFVKVNGSNLVIFDSIVGTNHAPVLRIRKAEEDIQIFGNSMLLASDIQDQHRQVQELTATKKKRFHLRGASTE